MGRRHGPADRLLRNLADRERRKAAKNMPAFSDDADMKQQVTLTQGEMNAWNQIAAGRPMRNSTAVLNAIKMKMEYTFQKPAQKVDSNEKVMIEIVNLGPTPDVAPPYTPGRRSDDIVRDSVIPEKEPPDEV